MLRLEKYIVNKFPDIEEDSVQLLVQGISILTEMHLDKEIGHNLNQYILVENDSWSLYFKNIEDYLINVFRTWPSIILFQIKGQLESATSMDEYLKVYHDTKFGILLVNTKMLSSIYPELVSDWRLSYNNWISDSAQILYQLAGISIEATRAGIREVVNEVVLHSEKYHNNHELFKKLIKRQYQLSLTEQNR